jgi:hypothetical protein
MASDLTITCVWCSIGIIFTVEDMCTTKIYMWRLFSIFFPISSDRMNNNELPHQRQQSPCHETYWIMVIDGKVDENSQIAFKCHPFKVCLDNASSARFMESVSQEFLRRLPLLMDTVLAKKIICSSSREILLNYLGNLSGTLSAKQLKTKFKCEDSFLLHYIKVVTHGYICTALANINSMIDDKKALHSIEHYKSLFLSCKAEAANIQIRHPYQEMYLGKP